MTRDLAPMLIEMSFKIKQIPMEDAYLGLLAEKLNSTFVKLWDNYMVMKNDAMVELEKVKFDDMFFVYFNDFGEFFSVWNKYFLELYYYLKTNKYFN
jgi:hypothetical protein